MTDRLSALLRYEAEGLDIPAPASGTVLAAGRRLRRRRRTTSALAGVAALALVAGGAALTLGGPDEGRAVDPAGPPVVAEVEVGPVFSIGTTLYLDGGARSATIDDQAIKSLYYTSAGVVVRHGDDPFSDGGGPQRFSLVRPDGTVGRLSVTSHDTVYATDPDEPYLAYARDRKGAAEVVVHDVRTDEDVAVVPLPGARSTWLPVSLSEGLVYVGADDENFVVEWRTGEVTQPDIVRGMPFVAGGHSPVYGGRAGSSVIDATTGDTLLPVVTAGYEGFFTLSPDGRFAQVVAEGTQTTEEFDVYDVVAGTHVTLPGQSFDYGWTADGDLFRLQGPVLSVCEADTGDCTESTPDLASLPSDAASSPDDFSRWLRLGGVSYRS